MNGKGGQSCQEEMEQVRWARDREPAAEWAVEAVWGEVKAGD